MNPSMIPCGNRIIIKERQQEQEEGTFLLPEGYSKKNDEHEIYDFISAGKTCVNDFLPGDKLVIHQHLIEEFEFAGEKTLIVGESAIVCVIRDSQEQ